MGSRFGIGMLLPELVGDLIDTELRYIFTNLGTKDDESCSELVSIEDSVAVEVECVKKCV